MGINYNKSYLIILERLLISVGIILFLRIGSFLPVPGINLTELALYIETNTLAKNFVTTLSGEDTFVIGLFTLNIFPYINASIIVQLIVTFSPSLSKLQKEGDLSAKRSIGRLTRIITLIWAIVQSLGIGLYLRQILFDWNLFLLLQIVLGLTTGAMIVLWLSELITDFGLGNGPSLLIYTNVISSFPNIGKTVLSQIRNSENFNNLSIPFLIILITLLLTGIVLLQDATRKIVLISSKQLNSKLASGKIGDIDLYIPLKLNQAGIMPIILTATVFVLPRYFAGALNSIGILPSINLGILGYIIYWAIYFGSILAFSLFYSTVVLNPKDMSEQLQKMSVKIPGIRPGIQTTFYLKKVMQRLNLIGGSTIAILGTFPNIIEVIFNISNLNGLSITSLLIMTGVLFDISQEIEDIQLSNMFKDNN